MSREGTALLCVAMGLAGCGDDGAGVRDAAGGDDAAVDGSTDDAGADGPSPLRARGTVGAVRLPFPDARLQLVAGFARVPDDAPGCTTVTSGACSLTTCPEDAGAIAVSGGDVTFQVSSQTFVLPPKDTNRYDQMLTQMVTPGVPIGIDVAGAEVPAFSTPALIQLPTALPRTAPPDVATFDRTQDLVITWTPAASGTAYVGMGQTAFDSPYPFSYRIALSCECPASAGTVTIPAALLGAFSAGPVSTNLAAMETTMISAGDFEVRVAVGTASTAWTSFTAE